MNKQRWSFRNHLIFSILITIISILSDLLSGGFGALMIIMNLRISNMNDASTIGIIGGVDGPTAMFYSGNPLSTLLVSKILLLLILLLLFRPTRKFILKVVGESGSSNNS